MYSCSDLKKGLKLLIDGDPHVIVQYDFTKPGKGQALYKCKLRNMITVLCLTVLTGVAKALNLPAWKNVICSTSIRMKPAMCSWTTKPMSRLP